MRRSLGTGSLRAGLFALGVLLLAHRADAFVSLGPSSASVYPTLGVPVVVTLSGLPSAASGTGNLSVTGPLGTDVTVGPLSYFKPLFLTTVTTTVVVQVLANGAAGTRSLTISDTTFGGGSAVFTLTVLEPRLFLSIGTPTITLGSSVVNVSVNVSHDPGFGYNVGAGGVPVLFSVDNVPLPPSTPANVTAGGQRAEFSPYTTTLTFPFSRTGTVVPGTYTVPVIAVWSGSTRLGQSANAILTLNIPDVSVIPPAFATTVCNAGPTVTTSPTHLLTGQYGFNGTPALSVTSAPAGVTVTPPAPFVLTSGSTVAAPFQLRAAGAAPGAGQAAVIRLQNGPNVVDKTFNVAFSVINPNVTAALAVSSISLQAGGASQSFAANTTGPPAVCSAFNTVAYTITGLPAGFTLPGTVNVTSALGVPYPAANLPVSAGAGVAPGVYSANVHFSVPATGQSGNLPVTVNVSAGPDFTLAASPPTITIPAGASGTVVFSLAALNGFAGTANMSIPAIQSITPNPNAFPLSPGVPRSVVFSVAANATAGTYSAVASGTAAGVPGTHSVAVSIVVPPTPDFTLTANPPALTLVPGATGKITFTLAAINGWTTPATLAIPAIPNVTAAPATGTFPGTGGSIDVFFTAAAGAPTGSLTFTATASAVSGPPTLRSANATLVIQPGPDFSLSVTPLSLRLVSGDTAPVTVTVNPLYGFAGSASVTAPAIPGITFNPPSFSLTAGASQIVQVTAGPGFAPATTTATFSGTAAGITGTRAASLSLTVDPKPDFTLQVSPPAVTIPSAGTTQVSVFAQPANGFASAVNVTAPVLAGVTFSPSSFTLPAGGVQVVDVTGAGAPSGTYAANFTGTASGLTRAGSLSVTVTGAQDFQVQLAPGSLVLPPGGTGTTNVSIAVLNGLGGTFSVSVTPPTGLTIVPASFTLSAGGVQAVSVTAAASASGLLGATFRATSSALGTTHSAALSVSVPQTDYVLSLSPSSLRLAPGGSASVAVTAAPVNGFTGVVTVVPALSAGVDVDLKSFTLGPGETKTVTVSLAAGATVGFVNVPFNGTTPGGPSHAAVLPLSIETAPDFTLAVSPGVINIPAGGRAPAQVTLVPLNGWSGGVDVAVTGSAGISVVPPAFPLQPGIPFPVEIRAADDAAAGAVTLSFRASGANGGTGVTVTRTVNVQVAVAAQDFNVRVSPPAPAVVAGRTTDLSFVLEPIGGFAGMALLTPISLPAGVSLTPSQPVLSPNVPQAATLSTPRGLAPGTYTLVFRADEVPVSNVRRRALLISKTVSVPLTVQPASGGFTVTVSPTTILASPGQAVAVVYTLRSLSDTPLAITGDSFVRRTMTGSVLETVQETFSLALPARGIVIVSNTILVTGEMFAAAGSPAVVLADRTFRAAPDESGFVPTATATVTATAANSLLATASATRISIVYPPSGTLVGRGNSLRAQGLVMGSGTGNLLVGWFFDGILVETATVPLQNGTPTSVSSSISLPTLISGNHEITLAVLSPNTLSAPAVQVYVEEGQQTLRLVSPGAGVAFAPVFGAPTFAWIPVPGIARYGVGIRRRSPGARWRWAYTTDTRWSPPASLWNALAEGDYEWGVRGYTNTGRVFLDSQSGGASAPPTSEGSLDMAEGWTVTSAQGRFSIGGAEAALQGLEGRAAPVDGGVRFSWKEIPGAFYVHTLYEQSPEGPRRVRTEVVNKPALLIPAPALPRGGPFTWRVSAVDKDGRPLGAMAAASVPVAGGAR